jgi:hypothetical protein
MHVKFNEISSKSFTEGKFIFVEIQEIRQDRDDLHLAHDNTLLHGKVKDNIHVGMCSFSIRESD